VVLVVGLFATYYILPLLAHVAPLPDPAAKMAFPQKIKKGERSKASSLLAGPIRYIVR
jgi:hypothetical protein